MAPSPQRRWLTALRWSGTVAMVAWVGWRLAVEWEQATVPALRPMPWELGVAAVTGAAALVGLALLYVAGLAALGLPVRGRVAWHLRTWLQGYVYRYVPGKVMLVVERARLGERAGIPKATSLVLVLWETLLLLAGACVLAGVGVGFVPLGAAAPPALVVAAAVSSIGLVLCFPLGLRALARVSGGARRRLPPALLAVPARTQAALVLGYAGVWALLGGSFALSCRAFEGGQAAGVAVAFWFVVSYVAGLVLAVTPAGLGVREGLLVVGLSGVFPAAAGLAFALVSRVLMTLVEGALVLVALRARPPVIPGGDPPTIGAPPAE